MARIVIQNALFYGGAKVSGLTIPWCTYTEPEVAHVGLYEHEARKKALKSMSLLKKCGTSTAQYWTATPRDS